MAAIGHKDLYSQKPDETKACHHEVFSKSWLSQTDALEGNGSDHGERGSLVRHGLGNSGTQIGGNEHGLGMMTVTDHSVPDLEICSQSGPDFRHPAYIAVTKRQGRIQLGKDGINSGHEPIGLDLVDDHPHLVRLLSGFLQVISLAEINKHALDARRNKGCLQFIK